MASFFIIVPFLSKEGRDRSHLDCVIDDALHADHNAETHDWAVISEVDFPRQKDKTGYSVSERLGSARR